MVFLKDAIIETGILLHCPPLHYLQLFNERKEWVRAPTRHRRCEDCLSLTGRKGNSSRRQSSPIKCLHHFWFLGEREGNRWRRRRRRCARRCRWWGWPNAVYVDAECRDAKKRLNTINNGDGDDDNGNAYEYEGCAMEHSIDVRYGMGLDGLSSTTFSLCSMMMMSLWTMNMLSYVVAE